MGAALCIRVLPDMPEAQLREKVRAQRAQDSYEDGQMYSGTWGSKDGSLIIKSTPFETIDQAQAYVDENSDKHGALLAVRAKKLSKTKAMSAPSQVLEMRVRAAQKAVADYPASVIARVRAAKSKTRGCTHCGSSIAVAHIHSNTCPVCRKEYLYTPADVRKLALLQERVSAAQARLDEQRQRDLKRATSRGNIAFVWVVGGWCPY
jgi:predicted RNA-binding Zn-ribbon protein involved in translation (DUF1610 family)